VCVVFTGVAIEIGGKTAVATTSLIGINFSLGLGRR
jgi:hypothetical protein